MLVTESFCLLFKASCTHTCSTVQLQTAIATARDVHLLIVCSCEFCNCAGVLKAETGGVAVAESTALKGQQPQQTGAERLIDCVKAGMRGGMPAEAGMSLPIATAAMGTDPAVIGETGHEMGVTGLRTGMKGLSATEAGEGMTGMEGVKTDIGTLLGSGITGEGQRGTDVAQMGTGPATELLARRMQSAKLLTLESRVQKHR